MIEINYNNGNYLGLQKKKRKEGNAGGVQNKKVAV